MPDAIITSTASTFGTISGTFAADQSTITGTVSGVITGTLSGSVGVPGPQGPTGPQGPIGPEGPPGEGGTWGSIVGTLSDQTDLQTALDAKQNVSGMSAYLTKAGNLAGLTDLATARDNLQLGLSNQVEFFTVIANTGTTTTIVGDGLEVFDGVNPGVHVTKTGIRFDDLTVQTTAYPGPAGATTWGSIVGTLSLQTDLQSALNAKYDASNPSGFITSSALTPYLTTATASATYQTLAGMSDYLSKAGNLSGLASTSTARTNLGLGSLAVINDAPSDGSQYARKNGAWDVVTATSSYITSVSSPLSVTSGNLTIDLSPYAPLASPVFTGDARAVTPTFGDNDTSIATTAFVQSALAGGTAVARNLEVEVRNQSGSTIPAGSIVYISGATGNKPLITLAQANNDTNSAQTIGFVKTSIANNGTGYVIIRGELENIDTSALTEGVQLYLSPTTAGAWTTTKPSAPQHLVYVGICVRSHPTLGTILVAVQNGYELDELHDVAIASKANNDLLAYESSTDLWKNKSFGTLGLLTSADLTGYATESWVSGQGYETTANAAATYYPLTNPDGFITTSSLSGYATESWVTSQGYLTSSALTGYATESWVTSQGYLTSSALTGYATESWVTAGFYPLTGNPSSFLVAADIAGLAPLASPSLTGNVTITTNSASPALFITQTGTGNILTLHDQASDTTFVAIDQNGKVNTIASTTANAGFNVPHGTAPTSPVNGDIWTTTGGIFWRQNGTTQQAADLGGTQTISGTKTFSASSLTFGNSTTAGTISVGSGAVATGTKTVNIGTAGVAGSTTNINIGTNSGGTSTATVNALLTTRASATTGSGLRVTPGTAPTSPVNGDVWTDTAGIYARINGVTQTLGNPAFATTAEINSPSATDKVVSPFDVVRMVTNAALFDTQSSSPAFSTSGTGAEAYKYTQDRIIWIGTPNTSVAGWGQMIYDTTTSSFGVFGAKRGANLNTKDFNKKIWMSGTMCFQSIGDANTTCRLMLGGRNSATSGSPTMESIGWKLVGGGSNVLTLVTYGWNGAASVVTETASSFTPVAGQTFDWSIYHEPNAATPSLSKAYLYVNDSLVATGIYSPTTGTNNYNYFLHTCESTASQATRMTALVLPTKIWWSKS